MSGMPRNPYIAGRALGGARGFYGREDVFQVVQAELEQFDRNAIVLFGQRRIGKTSILLNLRSRLPSPPFVPVYFDLMDRARKPLGAVLSELASTIAHELNLPSLSLSDVAADSSLFRRAFLPSAYEALGAQRRLVLLFDEFDVLDVRQEEQLPPDSAARSFFPYLRELMAHEPQLGFVFVVGRKAGELSTDFKAAFKAARYFRISVLDEDAARALAMTAQSEGSLIFGAGVVDRILSLTACHPYFTQLMCQLVFEQAMARRADGGVDGAPTVTAAEVEAAVPKALEAGENIYEWIWDGLPPAERVIFSAVAAGTDETTVVSEERLLGILQDSGVRILVRELELAPRTLIEWEMLREVDGGYRFFVELMRRWVAARKPLARVKDELDRVNPLADTLYQGGNGFYRAGQLDNAMAQLRQALAVNPNHLKARLLLAEVHRAQGDLDGLVRELGEAYRIDEDGCRVAYEGALVLRAESAEQQGNPGAALADYALALEIAPGSRIALERSRAIRQARGEKALADGDYRTAREAFREAGLADRAAGVDAAELGQRIQQLSFTAAAAAQAERWDEAAAAYAELVKLDGGNANWELGLANAARRRDMERKYAEGVSAAAQGKWAEAQSALSYVVERDAGYKDAERRLSDAAREAAREAERERKNRMTVPDSRRAVFGEWVLASLVGWLAAGLIGAWLATNGSDLSGRFGVALFALWVLGPIMAGLAQWPVLRERIPKAGRWPLATGLVGIGIALATATLSQVQVSSGLIFFLIFQLFLSGPAMGAAQWLILRRTIDKASLWVLLSAVVGVILAFVLFAMGFVSGSSTGGPLNRGELLVVSCLVGAVIGALYGTLTGFPLSRLLKLGERRAAVRRAARLAPSVAAGIVLAAGVGLLAGYLTPPEGLARELRLPVKAGGVAFSPDGSTLYTFGDEVRAWNVDDGTPVARLAFAGGSDFAVAPDGLTFASTRGNDVVLVDTITGSMIRALEGHTDTVTSLAISPGGDRLLSSVRGGPMRLWRLEDGSLERELPGYESGAKMLQFSPDGSRFLSIGLLADSVDVWSVEDGTIVYTIPASSPIAAYSPDGRIIAVGGYDVQLFSDSDGREVGVSSGPVGGWSYRLAFSPDGEILAVAHGDGDLTLWGVSSDYSRLERIRTWRAHEGNIWHMAFSPDGTLLATAGEDYTTRLWAVPDAPKVAPAPTSAVAPKLSLSKTFTEPTSAVYSVAFSPDSELIASGGNDEEILFWNAPDPAATAPLAGPLTEHGDSITSLAYSPDGKLLASGSQDQTILLWDVSNPLSPAVIGAPIAGHTGRVASVAFSPDGALLASGGYDNRVLLWDVSDPQTPRLVRELDGHSNSVQSVAFSPDGKTLASGGDDARIILWNVSDPVSAARIGEPPAGHTNWVMSVQFSPDGRTLASGSNDDTVRLWNVADPSAPAPWGDPIELADTAHSVSFSPDSELLVVATGTGSVVLVDVSDPAQPEMPVDKYVASWSGPAWDVAFSLDGERVVTAGDNGWVRVWDVTR